MLISFLVLRIKPNFSWEKGKFHLLFIVMESTFVFIHFEGVISRVSLNFNFFLPKFSTNGLQDTLKLISLVLNYFWVICILARASFYAPTDHIYCMMCLARCEVNYQIYKFWGMSFLLYIYNDSRVRRSYFFKL